MVYPYRPTHECKQSVKVGEFTPVPLIPGVYLFFLAVGVLRMIKMFGWEAKMAKRISDKREEELTWLWKTKVGTSSYWYFKNDIYDPIHRLSGLAVSL